MIFRYSELNSKYISEKEIKKLPFADNSVSGLKVLDTVDNMDSISASLSDWEILKGIREIPLSLFEQKKPYFYSLSEEERVKNLATKIEQSKTISPLIVVFDAKGPYILEGGHRFDALLLLNAKSLPALVVIDREEIPE